MLSVKVLLMVFVTHTDGINPSVKLFNGVVKESSGEKVGEVKISFRFSTDRDEPVLKLSEDEVEKEKDNISGRRSKKILVVMEFMEVS